MYGIMIMGGAFGCKTTPSRRSIFGWLNLDMMAPSDTKAETVSKSIESEIENNHSRAKAKMVPRNKKNQSSLPHDFCQHGRTHLFIGPHSCTSTVNATIGVWPSGSTECIFPVFFPKRTKC